ncbi:hypothetical protein ACFUN8_28455 [Streptomyces sp. NPDC057307]|uniref:hypothetical protein n=1 Tax=Streptomyces sp. NPDC057307 TaxID=3346096 RepID=UPI003642186D
MARERRVEIRVGGEVGVLVTAVVRGVFGGVAEYTADPERDMVRLFRRHTGEPR